MSVNVGIAFLAGILSFFSPCVFALVPAFIAYLTGINIGELKTKERFNKAIFLNTLFYVLGFVLVFTALGILLNSALAAASIPVKHWLTRIGGLIIVFFGLYLWGVDHREQGGGALHHRHASAGGIRRQRPRRAAGSRLQLVSFTSDFAICRPDSDVAGGLPWAGCAVGMALLGRSPCQTS